MCTLENPASSMLWLVPRVCKLISKGQRFTCDFCAFGTQWRKTTTFLAMNFGALQRLESFRCQGTSGSCSFSGRKHMNLSGRAPGSSMWLSSVAEPYPRRLCNVYAQALQEQVESSWIARQRSTW